MSTTLNLGNQEITYDYKEPAKAGEFNKLLRGSIRPGVYNGLELSNTSGSIIRILTGSLYLNSTDGVDDDKIVRAKIKNTVDLDMSVSPYNINHEVLYAVYTWIENEECWVYFGTRTIASGAVTNEVILGTWTAGDVSTISDSGRTMGLYDEDYNAYFSGNVDIKGNLIGAGFLKVDQIDESTLDNGIDIEGIVVKDGEITLTVDPSSENEVGNVAFNDDRYVEDAQYQNEVGYVQSRMDAAEATILDLKMTTWYLTNQSSVSSNFIIDTLMNEDNMLDQMELVVSNVADLQDDNDWNNNWKATPDSTLGFEFQQGFVRPSKQNYMLEVIDKYNLDGVGQANKCALSLYDTTRECYWLMTSAGGLGTLGEIVQLSKNLEEGKVEVFKKWYLTAQTSTMWTGIEIDETNEYLLIVGNGDGATSSLSGLGAFSVNSDGTLGLNNTSTGSTLTMSMSPDGTSTYDNISWEDIETNYWACDVCIWDDISYAVLAGNDSTEPTDIILDMIGRGDLSSEGGEFPISTTDDVTGWEYIIDADEIGFGIHKNGDILWIACNDTTTDYRFINKFDVTTDIDDISHVVMKSSGRFELSVNVDLANQYQPIGITTSYDGHILEVVSTTSNGKYMSKRALSDALWAENQISFVSTPSCFDSANLPSDPRSLAIESNRYIWTADADVILNQVDIFRYDTIDGTTKYARLTGQDWVSCNGIEVNTVDDMLYIIGYQGGYYEIFFGGLSDFVGQMSSTFALGSNTIIIGTDWGTLSGTGAIDADAKYDMAYDEDNDIVYVLNATQNQIDTLSSDGLTYTKAVYYLEAAGDAWYGLAYKDGSLYVIDLVSNPTGELIYELPVDKQSSSAWYRKHIYQDPSSVIIHDGPVGLSFYNDTLVTINTTTLMITGLKTLTDPDVLQLHTFIDSNNILLSDNISCITPIIERYFDELTDYADIRDMPDKNYCAVGYDDNGFTLLHLDEYLSDRSSTGLPRYDVSKIRVQNYEENTNGGTPLITANIVNSSAGDWSTSCIAIKDELIAIGSNAGTNRPAFILINLKEGTVITSDVSSITWYGTVYNGTLTERNDAKGYIGSLNTELLLSSGVIGSLSIKTFKSDGVSSYNFTNPKTYISIGTDNGVDLAVIDWDENNNRTLVKFWNNVFNSVTVGRYANWLSDFGILYGADYITTGNVYVLNGVDYIWELASDTQGTLEIGSSLLGGYAVDISANSRCWKTSSGEERTQLICSTYNPSASVKASTQIVDVEYETQEDVFEVTGLTATNNSINNVCNYEDLIFSSNALDGTFSYLGISKKLNLDTEITYDENDWDTLKIGSHSTTYSSGIWRPYFTYLTSGVALTKADLTFSTKHNILSFGAYNASLGCLQFFHIPFEKDNCNIKTKILETDTKRGYVLSKGIISNETTS